MRFNAICVSVSILFGMILGQDICKAQNQSDASNQQAAASEQDIQNFLTMMGFIDPMNLPENDKFEVSKILFDKPDGTGHIYGYALIPKDGKKKHPLVIYSHGFSGMLIAGVPTAKALAEHGVACYVFDFPGGNVNSKSDGKIEEMSILSEREELKAILDQALKLDWVDKNNVFLSGESQGGCVSALAAAQSYKKLRGLILIYPAFLIPDAMRYLYPDIQNLKQPVDAASLGYGEKYPLDARTVDIWESIAPFKKPVVIIHGTADEMVDIWYSEKALRVYDKAELKIIEGAPHGFYMPDHMQQCVGYITEYLDKMIKK